MKATDLIEKQHREVEDLFEKFEAARDEDKAKLFDEIAASLVAHDAIERELLYPAYERAAGSDDTLREALVEHGIVEFSLFRASKNRGKESFDAFVKALKEVVEHHVKEEEQTFIPKAEKKLGNEANQTLGARMAARFEEAKAKDFSKPLRAAVEQLLTGRSKIDTRGKKAPRPKATSKARTSPKKRAAKPAGRRSAKGRARAGAR